MTPIVDATNRKHFCHCRKFFWTAPLYKLVKTYDAPASLQPPVLSWFPTICTYVPSMLPAFCTTDSTSEDYHILTNNSFFLLSFSFMPMLDTRRYVVSCNPSITLCVGCCHPTLEKRKWRMRSNGAENNYRNRFGRLYHWRLYLSSGKKQKEEITYGGG